MKISKIHLRRLIETVLAESGHRISEAEHAGPMDEQSLYVTVRDAGSLSNLASAIIRSYYNNPDTPLGRSKVKDKLSEPHVQALEDGVNSVGHGFNHDVLTALASLGDERSMAGSNFRLIGDHLINMGAIRTKLSPGNTVVYDIDQIIPSHDDRSAWIAGLKAAIQDGLQTIGYNSATVTVKIA